MRRPCASNHASPGRPGSTAAPIALQQAEQPLPLVRHAGGVGRDEPQRRAAGERLPQPQPGAHAVGLGGRGGLADQLLAPRLRRERDRAGGQRLAPAGGDGELEAGDLDADDQERTHVRTRGKRSDGCRAGFRCVANPAEVEQGATARFTSVRALGAAVRCIALLAPAAAGAHSDPLHDADRDRHLRRLLGRACRARSPTRSTRRATGDEVVVASGVYTRQGRARGRDDRRPRRRRPGGRRC